LGFPFDIRKYEPRDEKDVLALSEKYASWDATPTSADIHGFWAREPDLFLVAEVEGRVVGFVFGQESRHLPDEVLRKRKATRVGSIETLAVAEDQRRKE
jgi:ribosomal protein S18 acetylase RimI-like enzyme